MRGMNAFAIRELVKRRVVGYDDTEYLSEINDAYKDVWEEIQQVDELFFSDTVLFTTTAQSDTFDLVFNMYGNLGGSIPRLHQIHRIRVGMPSGVGGSGNLLSASPRHPNDTEFLARSQQQNQAPITTAPFLYVPFGEGSLKFAQPLPVGTQIEVWYTFSLIDLQILYQGTVSTSGVTVTGNGTLFTQLVPPDLQAALPSGTLTESMIEADIIIQGQNFRVASITSDTALTTAVAPPAVSGVAYILASTPELPASEHRTIATIATRNMFVTPDNDPRFATFAALSERSIQRMKNTIMQRQRQENPKKGRFPYGTVRRSRFSGAR